MPVARLGFTIDSSGAVSGSKQGQQAIEGMAAAAKRAEGSMASASTAIARTTATTQRSTVVTDAEAKALMRQQAELNKAENARRRAENALRAYEATQKRQVDTERAVATAQTATAAASGKAVDGFAKVRGSLTALAASATNINGPLGSVVSMLTNLSAGSTVAVGVVAGVGAIALAYQQLTKEAQTLKKAQDEAIKSIEALAKAQRQGIGGELAEQIGQAAANIAKLRSEAAALTAQQGSAFGGAGPIDHGTGQRSAAEIKKELDQRNVEIAAAERELVRIIDAANREQSSSRSRALADLVKGNAATVAEQKKAASNLKNLQGQLADNVRLGGDQTERARLIADIKALNDALNPSTLKAQKDEMRLFNEQMARSAERASDAAKTRATLNAYFAESTKRIKEEAAARTLLKAQQDINAAKDLYEAKALEEKETRLKQVRRAMDALYDLGGRGTLDDIANANVSLVDQTESWVESLQQAVGLAQLLASAFGGAGREAVGIGNAAQSLLGGLGAAGRLTGRDGETRIGLGTALSGSEGASAFASGLSVVGQYAGAAIALADAFGLFDDAARKAREGQIAYTKALEDYAIVQRTSLQQSIKDDIAKANETAQGAFAASGTSGTIAFKSADELAAMIAALREGPGKVRALADELQKLYVEVVKNEAAIRREVAARMAAASEDLAIRGLIAQGRQAEADVMRRQLDQQRELQAAREQFGDLEGFAEYLAQLQAVQQAETDAAAAAEALAQAERALTQARQQAAFAGDLVSRRQSLNGDSRGAFVTRQSIRNAGELANAEDLLKAGIITQEMFDELARILNEELVVALREMEEAARAAAEAAAAERQSKFDDLAVRALVAQGDENGAARLRRELQNKKELAEATDITLMAEIMRVQALEEEAIRLAEVARIEAERAAQNDDITRRMIDAYRVLDPAKADELEQIREQIAREELLRNAVDDATRARYEELFALEDQAKAMKKLADEQKKAADAAEKLANLTATVEEEWLRATGRGFDADVKALERRRDERIEEARRAGASEETIRMINETFNANFQALIASTMQAATPATSSREMEMEYQTRAVARSISGLEALRLIDLAVSQLTVLRQIAANTAQGGAGGVNVAVTVQGGSYTQSPESMGASIGDVVASSVDESLGRRVGVDRRLAGIATL